MQEGEAADAFYQCQHLLTRKDIAADAHRIDVVKEGLNQGSRKRVVWQIDILELRNSTRDCDAEVGEDVPGPVEQSRLTCRSQLFRVVVSTRRSVTGDVPLLPVRELGDDARCRGWTEIAEVASEVWSELLVLRKRATETAGTCEWPFCLAVPCGACFIVSEIYRSLAAGRSGTDQEVKRDPLTVCTDGQQLTGSKAACSCVHSI